MLAIRNFAHVLTAAVYITWWGLKVRMECHTLELYTATFKSCWPNTLKRIKLYYIRCVKILEAEGTCIEWLRIETAMLWRQGRYFSSLPRRGTKTGPAPKHTRSETVWKSRTRSETVWKSRTRSETVWKSRRQSEADWKSRTRSEDHGRTKSAPRHEA